MFLSNLIFRGELFVVFWAIVMMGWSAYGIWKNIQKAKAFERDRLKLVTTQIRADNLLERARHLSTMAAMDQPFAVCESCNQIKTRYMRDENGVTCIECAEKHTERE